MSQFQCLSNNFLLDKENQSSAHTAAPLKLKSFPDGSCVDTIKRLFNTFCDHLFLALVFTLLSTLKSEWRKCYVFIPDFLYHLTNVFTNCSMNIDQLVFKLLEVTLVLVRKSLKFLLLRNQVILLLLQCIYIALI